MLRRDAGHAGQKLVQSGVGALRCGAMLWWQVWWC